MAASESSKTKIQQMYVAYYGRPGDPAGIEYWGSVLDVAESTGGSIDSIISAFGDSDEYTNGIGSGTTSEQVTSLYQQMFNRDPESDGLAFWVDQIDSGARTLGEVALAIAESAQNDDATTLANKVTAANYYTEQVTATGATYTSSDITAAQALISSVTSDPVTVVNSYTTTDTLLASQGGSSVEGGTFTLTTNSDVLNTTTTVAANKTTAGDDQIFGLTQGSLSSADIIDGGSGTDTLIADYDVGATTTTAAPVLTNVESVTIKNTGTTGTGGGTLTFSNANSTGTTSVTFDSITGATAAGTIQATNLTSGIALGLNNNQTLAHAYNYSFKSGELSGSSDTVTLNVMGNTTATGTVTITDAASTATSDTGAETVNIVTSGTGSSAATTIGTLAVTDTGAASMNTLSVSGTSNLTITNALDFEGTSSGTISATDMSGNLTLDASTGEAITFTGGSGKNTITTGAANDNLTGGASDDTFTIGSGDDTVAAGAGNDTVAITAITELTASDSIDLGDGTRDTLSIGTWTAIDTTNFTTANKALIAAVSGLEAIQLSTANATEVNYSAMAQDIAILSGGSAVDLAVNNVQTNDVLKVTADMTGQTGDAGIIVNGALPNQTFALELYGSAGGVDISNVNTAATDNAIDLATNISTVTIDSSYSGSGTPTANTIGGALNAGAHAIGNTSAQTFVITGNNDLTIANTGNTEEAFEKGVDVDASAFTGKLVITGSNVADIIKGGSANDTMTGGVGNDQLTGNGGNDTFVNNDLSASGNDSITDFTSGSDKLSITDNAVDGTKTTITSAGSQAAATNDTTYVIQQTSGAAAAITTSGTKTITDFTNMTQVADYLGERFTNNGVTEFSVIINNGTTSYVYDIIDAGADADLAGEVTLTGTITGVVLATDVTLS